MKRSFKNFFVILILVSVIAAGIGVSPVKAASSMGTVPLALPAGWRSGHLYGVWGASPMDVYAVGYGNNGSTTAPLVYYKSGTTWNGVGFALPAGWSSGYLFDVWGASAANVYMVGSGYVSNTFLPLLYTNTGGVWTAFTLALPTGWRSGYLYGIWGTGPTDIYAVGYGYSGDVLLPLLYHFNGSGWAEVGLSAPGGWTSANLRAVWASGPSNVYAGGYGSNGSAQNPVMYQGSALAWSVSGLSAPNGLFSAYLYGIWGSGASDVYAVGYGQSGSTTTPLVYRNNGSGWTSTPLTLADGWSRGYLYGVWGSSATDIYAVGSGNIGNTLVPLLYHNDGSGWTEASPSLPTGWSYGYLHDVWGSSNEDIYAVGTANNGAANLPLIYAGQGGQDLVAPGDVTEFSASTRTTTGTITLSWIEPADDAGNDSSGPVASYLVKYSTTPFSSWNDGATVNDGIPVPVAPGATQTMMVSGLSPNTVYYFAIRAQDEQYNLSVNYTTISARTLDVGAWYLSTRGNFLYGEESDLPVPGDYNGDGRQDIAVFRPSNGTWYISTLGNLLFGEEGDVPLPGDYNGDGRDEMAVFRPSNGTWYISTLGNFVFGQDGDIPVPGDYNGDGRDDIAVFRPSNSTWYIVGVGEFVFGEDGDELVPGDYNGDGRDDIAVFRPSDGTWYIWGLGNFVFGESGDLPVPGDYNGDGRQDIAVFRPSNGVWYISTRGNVIYGELGDIPIPGDYNGDRWDDIAVFRP